MFGHGKRIRDARASQRDDALRAELLDMADAEQRAISASASRTTASHHIAAELEDHAFAALSAQHAERLWSILDDYEAWPGARMVGLDGADAAWRIVMHARRDLELQERALDYIEVAVDFDDATGLQYATLADRVSIAHGKPQRFGTQVVRSRDGNTLELWPIEDPEDVDARRAALGIPTVADQLAGLRQVP
jgi:hypothetical protein